MNAVPIRPLWLSPSKEMTYRRCSRMYQLEREWEALGMSAAMAFGTACDTTSSAWRLALHYGNPIDAVARFEAEWGKFADVSLTYAKGEDFESMLAVGKRLMEQLPEAWDKTGFTLLCDTTGRPITQRKMVLALPESVFYSMKLDLLVRDREGRVLLLDEKATKSECTFEFLTNATQLTDYQAGYEGHAPVWNLPRLDGVGYWEWIRKAIPKGKRGEGPRIRDPFWIPPRDPDVVRERLRDIVTTARDIRVGRFPKRSGLSFETPCSSCDVARLCSSGDTTGLKRRERRFRSTDLAHAA
jgi:hypothetical protein